MLHIGSLKADCWKLIVSRRTTVIGYQPISYIMSGRSPDRLFSRRVYLLGDDSAEAGGYTWHQVSAVI
jgi:hypothetical protein